MKGLMQGLSVLALIGSILAGFFFDTLTGILLIGLAIYFMLASEQLNT